MARRRDIAGERCVTREILPQETYDKVKNRIVAKTEKPKAAQ